MNHSCNPTSLAPGFDLEIAIRDIREGEEITDDYGSLNLETEFACAYATEKCRHMIKPDDFDRYGDQWDSLVAAAFPLINRVEQPLCNPVAEKTGIIKVLAGEAKLPRRRTHFLDPRVGFGEKRAAST